MTLRQANKASFSHGGSESYNTYCISPFSIYRLTLDHPPLNTIGKGKVMLVYSGTPIVPKLGGHEGGVTQRSVPTMSLKLQNLTGHCDLVRHFWPYLP